jgi:hypothetical protein
MADGKKTKCPVFYPEMKDLRYAPDITHYIFMSQHNAFRFPVVPEV